MINITDKTLCCGCNACGDACTHDAIAFEVDHEGFWYPVVEKEKCVDCGLCDKVCPIIHARDVQQNDFERPLCFAANHCNLEVRFDSTSGGAFTGLAENVYKEGGYVGGAVYNDNWSVQQIISHDADDLPRLRSSKYLQSYAVGYYKGIKKLLMEDKMVMAVGLPCQIAALKAYLCKDYDNLLTVDLICRYINSPLMFQKYIASLERQYESKVVYFKSKNKEMGWRKLTFKALFANGAVYYGTNAVDSFLKAAMQLNCLSRPACYTCPFKGFPRYADISLGDFWINQQCSPLDDNTGTSIILINSKKGLAYFEKVKNTFLTKEVTLEEVLKCNPALLRPLPRESTDRDVFYKRVASEDFGQLVAELCSCKLSCKRMLKNIAMTFYRQARLSRWHLVPLLKFIKYNFFHSAVKSSILKGSVIFIGQNCVFEINRKANIKLDGPLWIGTSVFANSKLITRLRLEEHATLEIGNLGGNGFGFGEGSDILIRKGAALISKGGPATKKSTTIDSASKIIIGQETLIDQDVLIRDNYDGHLLSLKDYEVSSPIVIGEHVWIGIGCIIQPGAKIGNGSIVAPRSVVNNAVPSYVIADGNPAVPTMYNVYWKV